MKKKCLEIFSGTGSVGKVLTKHGWIVRSLVIWKISSNHFTTLIFLNGTIKKNFKHLHQILFGLLFLVMTLHI